jgi:diguanylate cyclase (GGDEF)-like protein
VRRAIEAASFTLRSPDRPATRPESPKPASDRRRITVTVSIGVAGTDGQGTTPNEVVRSADEALYRAKRRGRNRVCS